MRAVWIRKHGGPEVLEVRETPDPEPGSGEEIAGLLRLRAERDLTLLRGEASRRKQVQVALPERTVATWLDRVLCP